MGGSNNGRSYCMLYPATTSWTRVVLKVPGDTSGSYQAGTSSGLELKFGLYSGSNRSGADQGVDGTGSWQATSAPQGTTGQYQLGGTNGATWQITGLQVEAGTEATPFEHRSFGEELSLCQRYYYRINSTDNTIIMFNDYNNSTGNFWANVVFPVTMRSAPTATITSLEGSGVSLSSSTSSVHMLNLQSGDGAMYIGNSTIVEASAEL